MAISNARARATCCDSARPSEPGNASLLPELLTPHSGPKSHSSPQGDVWWKTGRVRVKTSGAETCRRFSQVEIDDPLGSAPPLHTHHHEDETFYVVDGEVTVFAAGERIDGAKGDFVLVPNGCLVPSERARMRLKLVRAVNEVSIRGRRPHACDGAGFGRREDVGRGKRRRPRDLRSRYSGNIRHR